MGQSTSQFYPPRARWYARVFYVESWVRRHTALDRIHLPQDVTMFGLIAGFLVPGLAVFLRGPRIWGTMAMAACAVLFSIFLVRLGFPEGNYAFGMIISIHVSGFGYYCSPFLRQSTFLARIGFTIAGLVILTLMFYLPLRGVVQRHFMMPLLIGEQVVVVDPSFPVARIQRGDGVAYTLTGYYFSNHGGEGVSSRKGIGLGKVLAVGGDRVEFIGQGISVNGNLLPPLPHMPKTGQLTVPENHWFIWPNVAITGNWHVPEDNLSSAMLALADVSETQFAGRPFKRWFWREQSLP